jgi:hypothetical protein
MERFSIHRHENTIVSARLLAPDLMCSDPQFKFIRPALGATAKRYISNTAFCHGTQVFFGAVLCRPQLGRSGPASSLLHGLRLGKSRCGFPADRGNARRRAAQAPQNETEGSQPQAVMAPLGAELELATNSPQRRSERAGEWRKSAAFQEGSSHSKKRPKQAISFHSFPLSD